jgi:Tol biopolymer transport system component
MRRLLGLVPALVAITLVAVPTAHATYPGKNGKLAISNGSPAGTPQEERNAFVSTINPDGTARTLLAADRSGGGLFSPDGSQVVFQSGYLLSCCHGDTSIEVIRSDGTERHVVVPAYALRWYTNDTDISGWSSNGQKLLFTHSGGKYGFRKAYTVGSDGSALTQVSSGPTCCSFDLDSWTYEGALGWLSTDRVAFLRYFDSLTGEAPRPPAIYSVNADGTDEREIQEWPASREAPLLSPDGRQIAFTQAIDTSGGSNTRQLFKVGIDGRGLVQLTHLPNTYGHLLAWSPDGSELLFARRLSTTSVQLDRVRADGSGQTTILSQDNDFYEVVWSPDSKKLALSRDGDIFVLNADGRNAVNVTNTPDVGEEVNDWQAVRGPNRSAYKNSNQFCKAEEAFWGDQFASRYGDGKNAYGKCVSGR